MKEAFKKLLAWGLHGDPEPIQFNEMKFYYDGRIHSGTEFQKEFCRALDRAMEEERLKAQSRNCQTKGLL